MRCFLFERNSTFRTKFERKVRWQQNFDYKHKKFASEEDGKNSIANRQSECQDFETTYCNWLRKFEGEDKSKLVNPEIAIQ